MPSPIAHSIAAALLGRYFTRRNPVPGTSWKIWLLVFFFSFAPDLDVILGVLAGDMIAYHNQWTHSLFLGLIFCLIAAPAGYWLLKAPSPGFTLWIALASYGLHLAMDWMTRGRGVMLLWPFREERFTVEPVVFTGLRWSEGWWSMHHLKTLANELTVGILFVALWLIASHATRGLKNRE